MPASLASSDTSVSATGFAQPLDAASTHVSTGLSPRRAYVLALVLVLMAGALVHGQRVQANLHRHHWEDWRFFRHVRDQVQTPLDCFTTPGAWPGLYRPLSTNVYYLFGRWAFDNRVEAYHAVNALLFVGNALLLFAIARQLLPPPWSFVPPILFVTRLAHYQVLLHTTEVQALLSTFFALAAILLFVAGSRRATHWRDGLSAVALVLGLLSKESVVVVPAILTAYVFLWDTSARWRRCVVPWLVTAAWLGAYVLARRHVGAGQPTGFTYDVSWAIVGRLASYGLSFLNILVWPIDSGEMTSRVLAMSSRPWVVEVVALTFLAALGVAVHFRASAGELSAGFKAIALGLVWFLLAMAPFVSFADRLFMRYTYFGHAGLALALGGATWLAADAVRRRLPWLAAPAPAVR